MTTAKDLQTDFFEFLKQSFQPHLAKIKSVPFSMDVGHAVIDSMRQRGIDEAFITSLDLSAKRALYELLTQYVILFETFPDLPFPEGFADSTSPSHLGQCWTAYFADRRYPFPGKLPH